jgi:hypothetical protein
VSRVALSAVFQVRDDRVLLDQSALGKATVDAMTKAVAKLLAEYGA